MSKIAYVQKRFGESALKVIGNANDIIRTYQQQGYQLTLRQLYYQFVSRDLIPNKVSEYKRLGSIINDARLAGLIDWNAIEDRTRNLHKLGEWKDPASIIEVVSDAFKIDKWANQDYRIEVWIEKEALAGVFERVCDELDVPFFACRGYTSQSEMHVAAMRLKRWSRMGQTPVILHFGDHDPSGIDMTRDIVDRLSLFTGSEMEVQRLALNMDQVDKYQPPPNPAKESDSRFEGYLRAYGDESWELDALEPTVLAGIVSRAVAGFRDEDRWDEKVEEEETGRKLLTQTSKRWQEVVELLS